ncbi:hypothetical protein L484_005967 [Morus notabilis]|uniref:Uncharacterized protein n=1 Tax=Morus notabilis TaxID=981085 RepID=W9RJC0_9ROSA|nr:hypothetical protein L484_005967 [Morus notabilis]
MVKLAVDRREPVLIGALTGEAGTKLELLAKGIPSQWWFLISVSDLPEKCQNLAAANPDFSSDDRG